MKITWLDIKEEIRKLGFADKEEFAQDYEPLLYEAVNSALIDLAQSVSPIKKQYNISHIPLENIIETNENLFGLIRHDEEDIVFEAENPKAFYFECDGNADIVLEISGGDSTEYTVINAQSDRRFEEYKGFINKKGRVKLTFSGIYSYNIRNIAMYKSIYSGFEEDIPKYSEYIRYDIKELTRNQSGQDFMCFDSHTPILKSGSSNPRIPEYDYAFEGDSIIVLPRKNIGEYIISYNAYPKKITEATPDSETISIEPNAAKLIPLFAASRIYKEDEYEKSILYYNEYSQLKNQIYNETPIRDIWVNTTGW